jgi:tetraacyldisaccharide-1-P 4'-kinase
MPKQLFDKDEFLKMADDAIDCLVVRRKDTVKLKVRRSRMMYIYVTNEEEANDLLKSIKVNTVEL